MLAASLSNLLGNLPWMTTAKLLAQIGNQYAKRLQDEIMILGQPVQQGGLAAGTVGRTDSHGCCVVLGGLRFPLYTCEATTNCPIG